MGLELELVPRHSILLLIFMVGYIQRMHNFCVCDKINKRDLYIIITMFFFFTGPFKHTCHARTGTDGALLHVGAAVVGTVAKSLFIYFVPLFDRRTKDWSCTVDKST